MPLENATRAIKRGTGELPGVHYEPFVYEGHAKHGIAIMVDTLSDNRNRTVAELRHIFHPMVDIWAKRDLLHGCLIIMAVYELLERFQSICY